MSDDHYGAPWRADELEKLLAAERAAHAKTLAHVSHLEHLVVGEGYTSEHAAHAVARLVAERDAALARVRELEGELAKARASQFKTLTSEQIQSCLEVGQAEVAANREYATNRYPPEKGGPAMKRLREVRKRHAELFPDIDATERSLRAKVAALEKELSGFCGPECKDSKCPDYDDNHPFHDNAVERFWREKQKEYVHKSEYAALEKERDNYKHDADKEWGASATERAASNDRIFKQEKELEARAMRIAALSAQKVGLVAVVKEVLDFLPDPSPAIVRARAALAAAAKENGE